MKGQITVEFLIVVIVFFLILNFALSIYSNNLIILSGFQEASESEALAFKVGSALNETYFAGDGASSVFIFVKTHDFSVNVKSGILIVNSKNNIVDFPLVTKAVDFSGFAFNQKLKFSNKEGVVIVEKAE